MCDADEVQDTSRGQEQLARERLIGLGLSAGCRRYGAGVAAVGVPATAAAHSPAGDEVRQ